MHERALLADLVREIESVAEREGASGVRAVHVRSSKSRVLIASARD